MDSLIYGMIIFDWDGTAVPDRHAPCGDLRAALEGLLKAGGLCAIVTGTNLDNILKQGVKDLTPLAKRGLHICTNRGSEVFDFDSDGLPRLIFRRNASQTENQALDQATIKLHDQIQVQGMRTEIIFDRLNRRKIDLIPEPEWSSPKKAQFRELLSAVEKRMISAGLKGGIPKLIGLTEEISRQLGLSNPKITSDIKHIEIGLTDKGDSARWIFKNIIAPKRIPLSKVSVWGDELGSLSSPQGGKLPGSDALMRVKELKDASFFSVGVEPEGVPSWVQSLGGGPKRFMEFLLEQTQLRQKARELKPNQDQSWILEQVGFDPSRERLMETLFAISNGNLGIRGSSDIPIPAAQSDLFMAGIYDKGVPSQPYSEVKLFDSSDPLRSNETEIVPLPFPFRFHCRIDGESIHAEKINRLKYKRCLDFKSGVYFEENLVESANSKKTEISSFRICSHSDSHLLIQRLKFTSRNYSGHIEIDLSVYPDELENLYPHLASVKGSVKSQFRSSEHSVEVQVFSTKGSKDFISFASQITVNGRELKSPHVSTELSLGETLVIERQVSVFWSKTSQESISKALAHSKSLASSFDLNVAKHLEEWSKFWSASDLDLPKDPGPTDALRFSLYHLQSSAALAPQTSIPAKALTGRAYEGHIFWDTEIFIFPFFLYTNPAIARQLLLYRYNTLSGARKRATDLGFQGAFYAWESTVSGEDVTPRFVSILEKDSEKTPTKIPIFTGPQELHITADIAWAIFKYWDATLDHLFMCEYGVEILIETARFWVSRVVFSKGHYHLKEIVGPDEYHHGVTDNAFTNWMVHFNLKVAIQMVNWLSNEHSDRFSELSEKLKLTMRETSEWANVMKRLYVPLPGKDGVIEQFEGFFDLKPVKLSQNEKTQAPISRLFDWKSVNQMRIVKQADVLMIPFLFPGQLPTSVVRANYEYYEPITDHGSSLSPCVHAAVAARIGKIDDALKYWRESLYFDLHNTMSNSQLGIHAAALGGTWQVLVFHLLGVRLSENGFVMDEKATALLPAEWNGLKINLKYRNSTYSITLNSGKPIKIRREAA